jgi:hypothetical protein
MSERTDKQERKYSGLSDEIYGTISLYFAPVVGIYDGIERVFEAAPWWPRKQLEKDRETRRRD